MLTISCDVCNSVRHKREHVHLEVRGFCLIFFNETSGQQGDERRNTAGQTFLSVKNAFF
jgi:hypothetical protein